MDDYRRRAALRMCDYYHRGILTADEACRQILFFCVEPTLAAEYVGLLPDNLRAALAEFLPTLPRSDEEWTRFPGVGQLDGNEWTWTRMIVEHRANTEAVRACLLSEESPSAAANFADSVRAAYRDRISEFCRSTGLRQQTHDTPGTFPSDES